MKKKELLVLGVAVLVLLAVLIPLRWKGQITTAETIEIIITFALVLITVAYVTRTAEIAKATKKQAEQMKEARAPSITMQWAQADRNRKTISVSLENEGLGPALNLECYLTHKTFVFTQKPQSVYTTFKVGQKYQLTLQSEGFDFEKWDGLTINCDYKSILGERYSSMLRCESKEKRILEVIKRTGRDDNQ